MREILFRGKTRDNEWAQGSLHIEYGETTQDGNREIDYRILGMRGECRYVIPETIGQYTGLITYWYDFENEPQEADVWEHDLLAFAYEDGTVIAEVKYEAGMFILCSPKFADSYIPLFDKVVVEDKYYMLVAKVGNIHDNPELLGGNYCG